MKITILIISVIVLAASHTENEEFSKWKLKHGRKSHNEHIHSDHEKNFMDHTHIIEEHNKGESDFELGTNEYSNVDPNEFIKNYCGTSLPDKLQSDRPMLKRARTINDYTIDDLPESIDYSSYVLNVKDQGLVCGSCWAFASTSLIEIQNRIKNSEWEENLSPQYLVDCSGDNDKCRGGWPTIALNFLKLKSKNMAAKSEDYEYTGEGGKCQSRVSKIPISIDSVYEFQIKSNEDDLRLKLANHGPLVIAIYVNQSPPLFQNYKKGIFYDDNCPKEGDENFEQCSEVNHSMLLVGYGVNNHNKPYFLVLNSWGESWGENGFARLARNRGNNCNIACYAMGVHLYEH